MPDSGESMTLELRADVQDYAAKTQAATEQVNKLADAVERVNLASARGKSAATKAPGEMPWYQDVSPYSQKLQRARRELRAMREYKLYGPEDIAKQEKAVESLVKKEEKYLRDVARAEKAAERDKDQRQKKQGKEQEKQTKEQVQARKRAETDYSRWWEQALSEREAKQRDQLAAGQSMITRAMYALGLGRYAPYLSTLMANAGALGIGGLTRGMGAIGGALGGSLLPIGGAMLAGGAVYSLARRAGMASQRITERTPGWNEMLEQAERVQMPEEQFAMTRTRREIGLGKKVISETAGEIFAETWQNAIDYITGRAGGCKLGRWINPYVAVAAVVRDIAEDITDSPYAAQQQENLWWLNERLRRELRVRATRIYAAGRAGLAELPSALPIGPQDEISRMGYFATAGQAISSTEFLQRHEQLIGILKDIGRVFQGKGDADVHRMLIDTFGWRSH